ncbi:hypothetical protein B0H19DRAFT_1086302 [Mycena capillaripes]|nr:hypothetical protein B0H19DRAFT_1086302 [Mycena capillaripes]
MSSGGERVEEKMGRYSSSPLRLLRSVRVSLMLTAQLADGEDVQATLADPEYVIHDSNNCFKSSEMEAINMNVCAPAISYVGDEISAIGRYQNPGKVAACVVLRTKKPLIGASMLGFRAFSVCRDRFNNDLLYRITGCAVRDFRGTSGAPRIFTNGPSHGFRESIFKFAGQKGSREGPQTSKT